MEDPADLSRQSTRPINVFTAEVEWAAKTGRQMPGEPTQRPSGGIGKRCGFFHFERLRGSLMLDS